MKNLLLLLFWMSTINFCFSQEMIKNGSFENHECDVCNTYYEFEIGCVTDWKNYYASPSIVDKSNDKCPYKLSYQAPDGSSFTKISPNPAGVFQNGDFKAGDYTLSFRYSAHRASINKPIYINIALANNLENAETGNEINLTKPVNTVVSQLVTTNNQTNWPGGTLTFTLSSDYSYFVIYASNNEQPLGIFPPNSMNPEGVDQYLFVDDVSLIYDCEPEPSIITWQSQSQSGTINEMYDEIDLICSEDRSVAFNIENLTDIQYNSPDQILYGGGSFTAPDNYNKDHFIAIISGLNSCGKRVTYKVRVNLLGLEFDASFNFDRVGGVLTASDGYDYSNIDGVTHEWHVLSSENPDGGPYYLEGIITGVDFNFLKTKKGRYYFVVQKIKTPCGDFCHGAVDNDDYSYENRSSYKNERELVGPIDCLILDNIVSECELPDDFDMKAVWNDKTSKVTLNWTPVNNTRYRVQIIQNDRSCTRYGSQQTLDYSTQFNSLSFKAPTSGCFSARVGIYCGNTIEWSDQKCFCKKQEPEGPYTFGNNEEPKEEFTLMATPNPAREQVQLSLKNNTEKSFGKGSIQIYSRWGELMDVVPYSGKQSMFLNVSNYPSGIYIYRFVSNEAISKMQKFVVQH